MTMAIFNTAQARSIYSITKVTGLRKLARKLVSKCQSISSDRQQLWRFYDDSFHTQRVPRCVWRRHGALLMYAADQKQTVNKVAVNQATVGKHHYVAGKWMSS
jgi:hypothetical protein